MKHYWKEILAGLVGIMAFVVVLGVMGDLDYCEQVILRMSQEEYDWVKYSLTKLNGDKPSEREIAHWWEEHHKEMP